MYVITHNKIPAPLAQLCELNGDHLDSWHERYSYVTGITRENAIEAYLYHFLLTWDERPQGVDVHEAAVKSNEGAEQ